MTQAAPTSTYFRHLAEGRFLLQHSPSTDEWVYYPRMVAPKTGATDMEWTEPSGLGTAEVDVVNVYDVFTINTILFLEDLGFCKKGEGGAFIASGAISPDGSLPVEHERRRIVVLSSRHVRIVHDGGIHSPVAE